jgi:hypothetical protein
MQLVVAGQWLMLAVAQRSNQHGSDKLNLYGHGIEDRWPWPGMSLNMVEPTPIHGQLLLLVQRSRKVMKRTREVSGNQTPEACSSLSGVSMCKVHAGLIPTWY